MRVILHMGPHKTGTTTVQHCLWNRYNSPAKDLPWYPPHETGPGHSFIFESIIKKNGKDVFRELKSIADRAECSALIVSCEDFANLNPIQLTNALTEFSQEDINLVFTLSPITKRIHSLWQESIKHGSVKSLQDSLIWLQDTASLAPDLVHRFSKALPKAHIAVAISDPKTPDMLWTNFERASNLLLDIPVKSLVLNSSFQELDIDILRAINKYWQKKGHGPTERWEMVTLAIQLFENPIWRQHIAPDVFELPLEWVRPTRILAAATIRSLRALRDARKIQIAGDLRVLIDCEPNSQR